MPQRYAVRVRFAGPADVVEAYVGRWAEVTPDGEGCRMTMATDTLDWPMMVLGRLDCDFVVEGPDELIELVARAADRFARAT
jgi:hypothetical protein